MCNSDLRLAMPSGSPAWVVRIGAEDDVTEAEDYFLTLRARGRERSHEVSDELVVEKMGRGGSVLTPPRRRDLCLLRCVLGELDAKRDRRQCLARIRASTSSAGTPVLGMCFRLDSARNA